MPRTPRLSKKFSKPTLSRLINGDISAPNTSPKKTDQSRLDHTLVSRHPEYSRNTLQKLIKDGSVTVNDEIITKPNFILSDTDTLAITLPSMPSSPKPKLHIIYEDDNVLVLDKPAGMLSMSKGEYNPEPTLEDYGLLVHRLDRCTSGVIILAKNPETKSALQKQFQQRKTHKTYHAIVSGHPNPDHAIINIPLARDLARPTIFRPNLSGREAITEYQTLEINGNLTLVKLHPTTGRTHQLRVHLSHIKTPILGDETYGGPSASRTFLHASELEITIPGGLRKIFKSPLPEEFTDVLRRS